MVERTGVLQLERAHGSGKAATLGIAHVASTGIEVTGAIGVATACGIHKMTRGISRRLVEFSFCIDDGTTTAQRDNNFADTPIVYLFSGSEWI